MGDSLGFEHVLTNRPTEDAFRILEGWFRDEKAKVRSAQRPNRIEASHGRGLQPMGWKKDAKKTMTSERVQQGPDVLVRVAIAPPFLNISDVTSREDQARANWNELLAELWTRFGETDAVREAVARPPSIGTRHEPEAKSRSFWDSSSLGPFCRSSCCSLRLLRTPLRGSGRRAPSSSSTAP